MDAEQQQAAVLTTPVTEIVLGAGQDGRTLAQEGVQASTFTEAQRRCRSTSSASGSGR